MIGPAVPHGTRIEEAVLAQPPFVQQRFRPRPKGAPQPLADGYREARFGTLEKIARGMAIKQLPQDELAPAAMDFHAQRNARRDGGEAVIEERNAGLETDRHRRPI